MKLKLLFLIIFFPISAISQVQIGTNFIGSNATSRLGRHVSVSNDGLRLAVGEQTNDPNALGNVSWYEIDNTDPTGFKLLGTITGETVGDRLGANYSFELSGDGQKLVVAYKATGQVKVFEYNETSNQIAQYRVTISSPFSSTQEYFGGSLAVSQDATTIAIGYVNTNTGTNSTIERVLVYQPNTSNVTTWLPKGGAIFSPLGNPDGFGVDLSLSNDGNSILVIDDTKYNSATSTARGLAYIYDFNSSTSLWNQKGNTVNMNPTGNSSTSFSSLNYNASNGQISGDGTHIIVAEPNSNISDAGNSARGNVEVYQYNQSSNTWVSTYNAFGNTNDDRYGFNVGISNDGSKIIISALRGDTVGLDYGSVRIFEKSNGVYGNIGTIIGGEASNDNFGVSLAMSPDGNSLLIGGNGANSGAGIAKLYNIDNASLSLFEYLVQGSLSLFPNPSSQEFKIKGLQSEATVSVFDINGREVLKKSNYLDQESINISNLSVGTYFVKINELLRNQTLRLIKD